jgi:hypothetical protein
MDLKAMPLGCVKVYADSLRKTTRLLTTRGEVCFRKYIERNTHWVFYF